MMNRQKSPDVWRGGQLESGQVYQGRMFEEAAVVTVVRGCMLVFMDGHSRVVDRGEMFLLPPGASYEYRVQETAKVMMCYFLPEMLSGILSVRQLVCHCAGSDYGVTMLKVGQAFERFLLLWDYYRNNELDNAQMQDIKCREFLCLLGCIYNKEELGVFFSPVMDERIWFRSFVAGNWKKARNVEELAEMANLSTSGFMKKFRRLFGEPPYKWMVRQKAECVLAEINSGDVPLKDIADRYHFASYAHFGTFCRKQYGVPPTILQDGKNGNILQESRPKKASRGKKG